ATVDEAGRALGDTIRLGPIKVAVPPAPPPAGAPLARFEQGIDLVEAALPDRPVIAGRPTTVELRWRATARPERDLTVFVHLRDAAGQVVAQDDRQPADRGYPTSIWDAGEQVADPHPLAPPPGRYRVFVGLYDAATLKRLPRADGGGDSVEVGIVDARAAVRG
ncbi:MAG TPA: hypothetical protein VGL23_00720, partial [Chloroflexota bacterium]